MNAKKKSPGNKYFSGLIAGLIAGMVLGISLSLALPAWSRDPDRSYRKLRIFSQVFHYIENNYVEAIDQESLVYGAISGMVKTLDRFTVFLPPKEYQKLKEDTTGEFAGLGIDIAVQNDAIVILTALKDSPAQRAGLKAGDRIVRIGGQSTSGMSLQQAVTLLRGPPHSVISLGIMRSGWDKARQVTMVRRALHMQSVEHLQVARGIVYARIKSFSDRTGHDLEQALRQGRQGQTKIRGLILDLRDNPGGLVEEAVRVADLFLAKGLIVSTQGRNPRHVERFYAHQRGTEPNYPVAVLVNRGSASASEIVAGALQDTHRAEIIGEKTYGKGSVQTIIELEDGSGLKLTVAHYHTPSGRTIHKIGIDPDHIVEMGDQDFALAKDNIKAWIDKDKGLAAALNYLRHKGRKSAKSR